ncbi:hypothetical protein V493_03914 [Pseudogymnoascus sp. VKM F-4281 (FW-2241)]|nr:hypothetical protein V493_03914 [Pseudogymnoascus sp. VKM F-4281 (FW-2241)]
MVAQSNVAFITGGVSGIGLAVVEDLVAKEWNVAVFDFEGTAGNTLAKKLGERVLFIQGNVIKYDELVTAFDRTFNHWGRIDLVFANAGIGESCDLYEKTADGQDWPKQPNTLTLDVNLNGVIWTSYLALAAFRKNESKSGKLVMTASAAALYVAGKLPLYAGSKNAVMGLARAMGQALKDQNEAITVNCLCPGVTPSGLMPQIIVDSMPPHLVTWPSTMVKAIHGFLADDAITGQAAECTGTEVIYRPPYAPETEASRYMLSDDGYNKADFSTFQEDTDNQAKRHEAMEKDLADASKSHIPDPDLCTISPKAIVLDACASYSTLDGLNYDLKADPFDITQKTDFFSYYRLNLFGKECPFWDDANSMCDNIACAVSWPPGEEATTRKGPKKSLQGILGEDVGESCVVEYDDESDERDYCVPGDESATAKGDYVSLVDNLERFTGYSGESAKQVSRASVGPLLQQALVLRAVTKLDLKNYAFYSGDPGQDRMTRDKVQALTSRAAAQPPIFNESLIHILDCVGCDKCRLWGKLQTAGYGASLKVLFEFDNHATDAPVLKRTELVTLFNTLSRISNSLSAIHEFRLMVEATETEEESVGHHHVVSDRVRKPHLVIPGNPYNGECKDDFEVFGKEEALKKKRET